VASIISQALPPNSADSRWLRSSRAARSRATASVSFFPSCSAPQVEIQSEFGNGSSYLTFKSIVPGAFDMGFIGSTYTALPL
jgi:hypothetical protein